jgi:hypothetical protein
MPLAGVFSEVPYLVRARQLCAEAEAAGARLIAWSATLVAMAWNLDEMKEAIDVASRIRAEVVAVEGAWACGIAQGPLETLSPDGHRLHLAWGEPLVVAASLARIARPGEVLIDGDVADVRSGGLAFIGSRSASDGGRRVRGWQLDLERPWRETAADDVERDDSPSGACLEELSGADVLELIEAPISLQSSGEDLPRLERERHDAEGRPPPERCRASLALAVGLAAVARREDALIETLDALARAREGGEPKALAACYALLAKLYAAVGKNDAAGELGVLAADATGIRP